MIVDYTDIIYDQPSNLNLCNKSDNCGHNVALAITRAIRDFMKERLYQELGFQNLHSQRRIRKLSTFYKIARNKSHGYIYK